MKLATWQDGHGYRGRAIEAQIETIDSTGTVLIEVLLEVTLGPLLGRRIKWKGWLNSEKNVKAAIEQLRAMGWRGETFGDWIGLGSEEIDFVCEIEEKIVNGKARRYPTAAFARRPMALVSRNATPKEAVEGLSRRWSSLLSVAVPESAPPSRSEDQGPPPDDDFGNYENEPPPEAFGEQGGLNV